MTSFGIYLYHNYKKTVLLPRRFEYVADPFIVMSSSSQVILFAERYSWLKRRGSIIKIHLYFDDNEISQIEVAPLIDEPFHLSFPYFYKIGKRLFLIPESSAVKKLYLYELDTETYSVIARKTIAEGHFVDPVAFRIGQRHFISWYTGVGNSDGETVFSEMEKDGIHNGNFFFDPSKTFFLSKLRSGGRIFSPNTRPVQTISDVYGKGLDFENLSGIAPIDDNIEKMIEESLDAKILDSSHHFDKVNGSIVMDCYYQRNLLSLANDRTYLKGIFGDDVQFIRI